MHMNLKLKRCHIRDAYKLCQPSLQGTRRIYIAKVLLSHCWHGAGVIDSLLNVVNALIAGESLKDMETQAYMISGSDKQPSSLEMFQKEFVNGQVTCQRMLEILVHPFLRLSELFNQRPTQHNHILNLLALQIYASWFHHSLSALDLSNLRPTRRTELMAALFEARVPQVSENYAQTRF